jgi:dTMP kinase
VLIGKNRFSAVLEALLFAADRVDHSEREVIPALQADKIVVTDRYLYSSLAYQGAAGLDLKWIEEVNRWAVKPDMTIYIDISPEIVLQRLKREKSVMETFQNQRRVRGLYLRLVKNYGFRVVDGNKPKRVVAQEIMDAVTDFLSARGV